jgi:hypothetical protein
MKHSEMRVLLKLARRKTLTKSPAMLKPATLAELPPLAPKHVAPHHSGAADAHWRAVYCAGRLPRDAVSPDLHLAERTYHLCLGLRSRVAPPCNHVSGTPRWLEPGRLACATGGVLGGYAGGVIPLWPLCCSSPDRMTERGPPQRNGVPRMSSDRSNSLGCFAVQALS